MFVCTQAFILENRRRRTRSRSSHSRSFRSTLSEKALVGSLDYCGMFVDYPPPTEAPPGPSPVPSDIWDMAGFVTYLFYFFSRAFFLRISSLICSRASKKNCSTSDLWSRMTYESARTFLNSLFLTLRFSRAFMISSLYSLMTDSCW